MQRPGSPTATGFGCCCARSSPRPAAATTTGTNTTRRWPSSAARLCSLHPPGCTATGDPYASAVTLRKSDANRVRTLTMDRPDALNAFNEALYEATATALAEAAADPEVAVVLLTGNGRAFSAGNDLNEMAGRIADPSMADQGSHFTSMIDALTAFPKPLICAVNGLGVGIGTTILGYADLVFMSSQARLKCPFTSLGVAPEAASSYLLPQLVGRQNAAWLLMSSEWIDADEAFRMGLVWKVCEPSELIADARRHAEILASRPISSLIAVKQTIAAPSRAGVKAATERENAHFAELMGADANADALAAFTDKRQRGGG